MKKLLFAAFIFVVIRVLTPTLFGQAAWKKIPIPQLPTFHPQEPKRIQLPNGMVIFLQEDHELPTIDGIARIRGGSRSEPAAKIGLVSLYGEVWRTGGTKTQTGDQFDDYLEIRAAKVETGGNADSTIISLSCLKEDFDDVFKAFIDLLREPEFREAKLREAFGGWEKGPAAKGPEIQFTPAKPGYYLIKKEDVNQSSIHMVELGTTRDNPDYYPIEVFNEVFAGGFSSRLVQSIRTAQGLAYAVGGGIGTHFDHPGILQLGMGTKSGTTVESIQALYAEIDNLSKKPITDAEIARAKDSILNTFVFNFDTPDKVLRERMAYEYYGYPADFLERYRAGIEKVTAADVARIIPKYLHKDQLAVLVVGNTSEFDKPLSSLGPVADIDITIPPPSGEKSKAAPASEKKTSNPEGKALAAKVAKALGGESKLQTVKSLKSDFTLTQPDTGTAQVDTTIVFPDHMQVDLQTPQGTISIVVTPDSGFMSAGGMGTRDMPASRKNDSLEQIHRDLIYVAQHVDDPAFSFTASGLDKTGNTELAIVDVSGPGTTIRWFVDPQTGKVTRIYEPADKIGRAHV